MEGQDVGEHQRKAFRRMKPKSYPGRLRRDSPVNDIFLKLLNGGRKNLSGVESDIVARRMTMPILKQRSPELTAAEICQL